MNRFLPVIVIAALTAVVVPPAAASVPWRTPTVGLRADQQSAGQLLRMFAAEQGLVLELADGVAAPVSGDFRGLAPGAFLDAVCESAELTWFWDGGRLHVGPSRDIRSRVVELPNVTLPQVTSALAALGFASGPAGRAAQVRGGEGIFTLSGGPAYLEIVEPVLRSLDTQTRSRAQQAGEEAEAKALAQREAGQRMEVRVFRLKYAHAGDLSVRGGATQTLVPGVARALQNIMGLGTGGYSTGIETTDRRRSRASLFGTGLAAVGRPPTPPPAGPGTTPGASVADDADPSRALIQAEPRLNAVIVRDAAARMPVYESLIAQLDVPSPVIEISAAVVDIDASNGRAFGIEFLSFGNGNGSTRARVGFEADRRFNEGDGDSGGTTPRFVDGTDVVRGGGFNTSVLVPVSGYELLTRIRALEEKGEAQLVTSPSVITLENVEANLRQEETVFVRVAGREATDLFDVRAGVQLRVTPTVVREGDTVTFRLVVDVQDGSFSDLSVDGVPSTRESAISTQAVVPGDRTLLIGGYFVERVSRNVRQVPVVGNVPVLGRLFQRTEDNRTRAQRFFFITPRLVDVNRESRSNLPPAAPEKSPLPAGLTEPEAVNRRAHEMVGRSLAPSQTVPVETSVADPAAAAPTPPAQP
jgi:type III secretion protein C